MKIKSMLARLQNSLGHDDLIEQMVLLPEPKQSFSDLADKLGSINLVVGYSGSPKSHTALDIAFWMAHQTHLATNRVVTVHAVYVETDKLHDQYLNVGNFSQNQERSPAKIHNISPAIAPALASSLEKTLKTETKQADKILWQAFNLAEEWEGSFKSHLRFGSIGRELRKIVESEVADILFLGCRSINHPLIETMGDNFPCAVLGIPNCMDD